MLLPIEAYRKSEQGIRELYGADLYLYYQLLHKERLKNARESIEWHMNHARKHKKLNALSDTVRPELVQYHVERARHFCRVWRAIPKTKNSFLVELDR